VDKYSTTATTSPFTASTATCYDAVPSDSVYVVTDGVTSNTISGD
jgi:hypothetical protein